jgi:hypothetical protein
MDSDHVTDPEMDTMYAELLLAITEAQLLETLPPVLTPPPVMVHVTYHRGDVFSGRADIESFDVADDVEEIDACAFQDCINLKSLQGLLTSKVTKIGGFAFAGCTGIASLVGLPQTLATIGKWAFGDCSGIASLEGLPSTLTSIGGSAFERCVGITSLHGLPSTLASIADHAFAGCSGIASLEGLPSALALIGAHAFDGCAGIASVGRGFTPECYIHYNAFRNCPQLEAAADNHFASLERFCPTVEKYGKAVWRLELACNLRCTVLASVQTARRLIDDTVACPPHDVHPLLRRLAKVPSSEDNKRPYYESQVLRHIVAFVGGMNMNCWTLLNTACLEGHLKVAKMQVEKEADIINKTDEDGYTPLHKACQNGHMEVARMLVDNGADKDKANDRGYTPLKIATLCGHPAVVAYLKSTAVMAYLKSKDAKE